MKANRFRVVSISIVIVICWIVTACGVKGEPGSTLVKMSPFTFAPSILTVKAGSHVTLRLRNLETFQGEPHDWTLMEANYTAEAPWTDEDNQHALVQKQVHPNETQTLTFVAPSEPGEYQVVCTIWLGMGMQGKLVVTP